MSNLILVISDDRNVHGQLRLTTCTRSRSSIASACSLVAHALLRNVT
jgi:hypothetical protein